MLIRKHKWRAEVWTVRAYTHTHTHTTHTTHTQKHKHTHIYSDTCFDMQWHAWRAWSKFQYDINAKCRVKKYFVNVVGCTGFGLGYMSVEFRLCFDLYVRGVSALFWFQGLFILFWFDLLPLFTLYRLPLLRSAVFEKFAATPNLGSVPQPIPVTWPENNLEVSPARQRAFSRYPVATYVT
jgi:hypothetical protein